MLKLNNSGYNTKYRKEILDSALSAYENIVSKTRLGPSPCIEPEIGTRRKENRRKITEN